jgi:hypothetical protein
MVTYFRLYHLIIKKTDKVEDILTHALDKNKNIWGIYITGFEC